MWDLTYIYYQSYGNKLKANQNGGNQKKQVKSKIVRHIQNVLRLEIKVYFGFIAKQEYLNFSNRFEKTQ